MHGLRFRNATRGRRAFAASAAALLAAAPAHASFLSGETLDKAAGEPVAAVPLRDDVARLRGELDALMARSQGAPEELKAVREQLASLERRPPAGAEEAR